MIQPLIPKVAAVVKHLVSSDETKRALKFMEIFEKWFYRGIPILWDHLEVITDIFMVTALRKDLDDAIRVKALHFLRRKLLEVFCYKYVCNQFLLRTH